MSKHVPVDGERLPFEGKTIATARYGQDNAGDDYVSFLFTDGTCLRVEEASQTGQLRITLLPKPAASPVEIRVK